MKAILIPLYFKSGTDADFKNQVIKLRALLDDVALILEPIELGSNLPRADAVIFPQLIGDAFKQIEQLKKIKIPFIVATSEFGAVNMWDWEIVSFFKSEGLAVFSPYNLGLTKKICKSLALKEEMKSTKFLMFQDNPGVGMQAEIFKRFFWWEDRCTKFIKERFGIEIIKKSFRDFGKRAMEIDNSTVNDFLKNRKIDTEGISQNQLYSAVKICIQVIEEIEKDSSIKGVGINCLNESFFSDATPCLAWSLLYEEKKLLWACEADTLSLMTMYLVNKSLDAHIMTSNIYPFLMGMAALKHEKIPEFPKVDFPQNYLLVAHCGYFGVVPQSFCSHWTVKPKVLDIVNENAIVLDARMPIGEITVVKLDPSLSKLMVVEGVLKDYVQYPGSHCRNGAILEVKNGYKLMNAFYSHHNCLVVGHMLPFFENMAKIFNLEIEYIG